MQQTGVVHSEERATDAEEGGIDLFDVLLVLSESRRKIAIFTLVTTVLGLILVLSMKPIFTATALILPPEQGQSLTSALMGQLGPLASLAGGSLKNPADMYLGILASRTIADQIIEKYHLQQVYKTKHLDDARTRLKANSRFLSTKDGLIRITVEDHDAKRASDLTNAYVDQLYGMNSHLAITEAAQRRVFFDEELAAEKNALEAAENNLKRIAEKTGVIQLGGQAESIIRSIAELRAQIYSREVQIQSLRTYATDQNPDAVRIQEEINTLRTQLAQIEKDPRNLQSDTASFSGGGVPSVTLEYLRGMREVKYHEALFDLLSKQYEAARIDEAKAAPVIQIVDRAVIPDGKSGPHRLWITIGFAFFGFFLGCLVSFLSHTLRRMEQTPEYALKMSRLKSEFPFSR